MSDAAFNADEELRSGVPGRVSQAVIWVGLYTLVLAQFFFAHLFLGRSILPLDVLNQMLLPRPPGAVVDVQTHYPIDEVTQLAPNAQLWAEAVRDGGLPTWNPYILGGQPHMANSIWGVLTPFKAPLLMLAAERGYTVSLVIQFWLAGLFLFPLLRELGRSWPACFVGAVSWALCSNLLLFHWLYLNVFTWLPLVLWSWERHLRFRSAGWALAASMFLALAFVGGSVQFAVFSAAWFGLYSLGRVSGDGWRERLNGVLGIAGAGLVAGLLGAVQFVPFLEFLPRETQRLAAIDTGAFGLRHAVLGPFLAAGCAVVPGLAGSPGSYDILKLIRATQMELNGYIGIVPLGLAVVGAYAAPSRIRRSVALLFLVPLGVVFFTPLQKFLYHRFLLLSVFAAVVWAAFGLDAIRSDGRVRRMACRVFGVLGVASLLVLGTLVAGQAWVKGRRAEVTSVLERRVLDASTGNQFVEFQDWFRSRVPRFIDHYRASNPTFAVPVLAGVAAAGAAWLWGRGRMNSGALQAVLLVLVVLDVSVTLRDRVPCVDPAREPYYPELEVLKPIRADPDRFRVHRWFPDHPMRFRDNVFWAYGLSTATGYDSLAPNGLRLLPWNETNGFSRWLDAANIKYVFAEEGARLPSGRFEMVAMQPGVRVWRNKDVLPRIHAVGSAVVLGDEREVLGAIRSGDLDPHVGVYLERSQAGVNGAVVPVTPPTKAVVGIEAVGRGWATATVTSDRPVVVVHSETWYPGWRAYVNKVEVPLLRANGVMQAAIVPAGSSRVEFRFEPGSIRLGAVVSLATLAVSGWMVLRARKVSVSVRAP